MFLDKKLLLFGGKGGVGKTSCAAATSLYAASQGKKTLILSTDPAHSLSDSFEKEIGDKVTTIRENLDALEINTETLLEKYKKAHGNIIKQIADEGTFFSKKEIQEFFDLSLPGMDELMALMKVIDIIDEKTYDLLILDTAPTGHTIRFLESPDVLTAYSKVLAEMRQKHKVVVSMMMGRYIKDKADEFLEKMQKDVENIKTILHDSDITNFIVVTIPEALGVYETEKLLQVLEKYHIPIGAIIINGVMNKYCDFCTSRRLNQEKYIKELKEKSKKYPIQEVPLLAHEIKGDSLETLSKILFEENYQVAQPKRKGKVVYSVHFDSLQLKQGLQFLLFGGKGGVGKTSCAAATSLYAASQGKKTLILSTDPAHSLSDSFEKEIGDKVTTIRENLDALEIDSYKLLDRLKTKYKKEIRDFFGSVFKSTSTSTIDAPYDRRVMEDLFDLCPPGIDEIMALKTIIDLMQEKKYDLFILDTAPSGHTIRLLELPEIAEAWVKTLLGIQERYPLSFEIGSALQEMLDTIQEVRKILADPKKTEFVAVTIPEAMGYLETTDLIAALQRLKVPLEYLIVNKILLPSVCNFCNTKLEEQIIYVNKLREAGLKTVGVELFSQEIKGEDLIKLSKKLFKS